MGKRKGGVTFWLRPVRLGARSATYEA